VNKDKPVSVDVVCGGCSEEHDVSILSGVAIANALLEGSSTSHVHVVFISPKGEWFRSSGRLIEPMDEDGVRALSREGLRIHPSIDPTRREYLAESGAVRFPDVFFPVLHGRNGEDGAIQGVFQLAGVPCVGCGVVGGACGMDKDVSRRLFASVGLPLLPWMTLSLNEWDNERHKIWPHIVDDLGSFVFVKPVAQGSSVGISKVKSVGEFETAMGVAFSYGERVIIEKAASVREIEVAVLGNLDVKVSVPGEVIPGETAAFYDYQDKYLSGQTRLEIPARLNPGVADDIRDMAVRAFRVIGARGLSRVDFFVERESGEIYINEINTFPGFTRFSMYPKLWENEGLNFPDLIKRLVALALAESTK